MNEAKHTAFTPGPWSFDGDWYRIPTIFGADGTKVAFVTKDRREATPEREANARLIAAAPELLSELHDVLEWAIVEKSPLREQEIESIKRVIAKAGGRS